MSRVRQRGQFLVLLLLVLVILSVSTVFRGVTTSSSTTFSRSEPQAAVRQRDVNHSLPSRTYLEKDSQRIEEVELPPCCIVSLSNKDFTTSNDCQLQWSASRSQWQVLPVFEIVGTSQSIVRQQPCRELHHHQQGTPREVWYVVEDGCAMGHMLKDVGAVAAILLNIQKNNQNGTGTESEVHVVFGNRCVTAADVAALNQQQYNPNKDDALSFSNSLFGTVLQHWWALLHHVAREEGRRKASTSIHFHASTEMKSDGSFPTTSGSNVKQPLLLFRRAPHWRWFPPVGAQAIVSSLHRALRHQLQQSSVASFTKDEKKSAMVKIIIVRRKQNRRFAEDLLLQLLQSEFISIVVKGKQEEDNNVPLVQVEVVVLESLPYLAQLQRLHFQCDILIGAHGAALASAAFLPQQGSALIELFPPLFRYSIYQELAMATGCHYYAVEGQVSSCGSRCAPRKRGTLNAHGAYEVLREWNGRGKCKNCDIGFRRLNTNNGTGGNLEEDTSSESAGLKERVLPVVEEAVRAVLMEKVRAGKLGSRALSTTLFLDRRG